MPPTLHAAIYAGLLDAGMDVPRVPGEKLPTDDDGNYNPVAELALLWGSLSAGVAKDLEEQIATAEAQLQASSAGDGLSRPQSADFRRRSLKAPQEPPPSRRSLAASAQKGIPCSEPPSRLEFHLWSPRSTQPARAPQKHVVVRTIWGASGARPATSAGYVPPGQLPPQPPAEVVCPRARPPLRDASAAPQHSGGRVCYRARRPACPWASAVHALQQHPDGHA